MRWALVLLALGACRFDPAGLEGGAHDDAGLAADAGVSGDGAPAPDATATSAFCANDPALVGCWRFEGNGDDGSAYGNHAIATTVTYPAGHHGTAIAFSD